MTTTNSRNWADSFSIENLFTERSGKDGLFLSLAAIPTLLFCVSHHFCMGGHMAHPPYPSSEIVMDFFTLAFLLSGVTLMLLSSMPWRYAASGLMTGHILMISVWWFGPLLLLWLVIAASIGLMAWFRRTPKQGRAFRLFEEIIAGFAGLAASWLLVGFGL